MRRSLVLALILAVYPCAALLASDLTKIDRPAIKLPELPSGEARYCLLVFGPDAAKRVWLAHDGDRLYVDRNGNGDLTEPGETVTADATTSKPAEGVFSFKAGDIPDIAGGHKELSVMWGNIDHMRDLDPFIKERLEREPNFRGCRISLDVAMPGHQGKGIEGRVNQLTSIGDCHGLLEFATRIEDAPIIHFGGSWEVTLSGQDNWRAGRTKEVVLVVGTRGVGPGTTACVAYQNVIPVGLKPLLEVTYPSVDGTAPFVRKHELTRRCCGVNLYGDVAVPDEVPAGVATVNISLESWSTTTVAATKHDVQILPALPGPKVEPVSWRLASRLEHEHRNGTTGAVQFSPDGNRLIAGDYPGGLVHVWELAGGKRLATFDMGEGLRASLNYFVVTPDWKTIISPTNTRGEFDRFQKDGKTLSRVRYDGSIRVWDLESGSLLHTWQDNPPRSTRYITLLPDNKRFLAYQETPGEFESQRPRAVSVWDVATGEHKQLFAGHEHVARFSPDGQQAGVSVPRTDNISFHEALALYDATSWQPVGKIPLQQMQRCYSVYFLQDAPTVVGIVYTNLKPDDFQNARCELKFWTLPGGEESWSLAVKDGEAIHEVKQTPDHRALYVTTFSQQTMSGRVLLVDLATHDARVILDEPNLQSRAPVFHPGGQWMILPVQKLPKSRQELRRDISAAELAQPHLQVRDIATGALLEDVVAPSSFPNSVVFSPDGNTLATSGTGAVLLWDFRDPPGKGAAATVGQPFEAAGTLVGGKKLDWAAYRGKVVLVTYWATWCKPCVAEIPELKKTYDELRERGFDVLAVSLEDDHETLERFLNTQEVPWQVVCGATAEESGLQHPLARKYGVESVPKSFLLDRQGNIAGIDLHGKEFLKLTEELLGPKDERQVPQ